MSYICEWHWANSFSHCSCVYFLKFGPFVIQFLIELLQVSFRSIDVLDIYDLLSSGSMSSICFILSGFWPFTWRRFDSGCPGILVNCPTGARLESTVLKETVLSLLSLLGCGCYMSVAFYFVITMATVTYYNLMQYVEGIIIWKICIFL